MLKPGLEALHPREEVTILLCTLLVPSCHFLLDVVLVEIWADVDLDSVVPCRDRLYISLYIRIFLALFNKVNVVDDEKGDKDSCTPHEKAHTFAISEVLVGNYAAHLEEHT